MITRRSLFALFAAAPLARALPAIAAPVAPPAVGPMFSPETLKAIGGAVNAYLALFDSRRKELSGGGYERVPIHNLSTAEKRSLSEIVHIDVIFPKATADWPSVHWASALQKQHGGFVRDDLLFEPMWIPTQPTLRDGDELRIQGTFLL